MRLTGGGAGLGVADPLLRLSSVTTAGTLAVPVSLPLPSSTSGTARPELSPLTPAWHREVRSLLVTNSGQVRSGQSHLQHHWAVHSSRPSRGSRLRTSYSCCCHTPDQPGSPGGRREVRRQPGRHSRPGRHHRDSLECSTACPGSSVRCTSRLEEAPATLPPPDLTVLGEVWVWSSASHSSRPWGESRDRTGDSCWSRTPGLQHSLGGRRELRPHQVRHSLPLPPDKDSLECSISSHRNSSRRTSDLPGAPGAPSYSLGRGPSSRVQGQASHSSHLSGGRKIRTVYSCCYRRQEFQHSPHLSRSLLDLQGRDSPEYNKVGGGNFSLCRF